MTKGGAAPSAGLAVGILCLLAAGGCGTVDAPIGLLQRPPAPPSVRAAKYARAVNLRASDLPYLEVQADTDEGRDPGEERRAEREVERCLGFGQPDEEQPLAEVESPDFAATTAGAFLSIQSSVEVQRDIRGVAKAVRILRGRRVADCLRRVYVPALEQLEPGNVDITGVSITRLRPPLPGVDLSFGFRIYAVATAHPGLSQTIAYRPEALGAESPSLSMHVDLLTFIVGAAQVNLTATATPAPASRTLERNLLTKMHERALANRP